MVCPERTPWRQTSSYTYLYLILRPWAGTDVSGTSLHARGTRPHDSATHLPGKDSHVPLQPQRTVVAWSWSWSSRWREVRVARQRLSATAKSTSSASPRRPAHRPRRLASLEMPWAHVFQSTLRTLVTSILEFRHPCRRSKMRMQREPPSARATMGTTTSGGTTAMGTLEVTMIKLVTRQRPTARMRSHHRHRLRRQ